MFYGLVLIVVGLLASYPYIVSKRPDAAAILDKITPWQGWIGVVVAVWGVFSLVSVVLSIGLLSVVPVWWLLLLGMALLELALGFLLGYNLIVQYVLSKNAEAARKGAAIREKLIAWQTPLGLAAVVLGVLGVIFPLVLM
ncbi:MAG: hypothetical protein M3O22_01150 [Pseudomonadota bacterium]|nr:hypothetical protein [Pseudomonadota bacterium]